MFRGFCRAARLATLICCRGASLSRPGGRSVWSECCLNTLCPAAAISHWAFPTSIRSFCAAAVEGVEGVGLALDVLEKNEAHKARFALLVEWGMKPDELRKVVKGVDTIYESENDGIEPKLRWLMEQYGFDKSQVLKVVQTFPPYFNRSLHDEVAPFLNVFAEEGYSVADIKKMIKAAPWVLGLSSEFEPTMEFFSNSVGLNRKAFIKLVVKNPALLRYSIDTNLRPKIDFFKGLGLSNKDMILMLRDSPKSLRYSLENNIKPNLEKLTELGFEKKDLELVVKRCPQVVARNFHKIIEPKFNMLEKEVGMGRRAVVKHMVSKPADFLANIDTWRGAFKWFLNNYRAANEEEALEYLRKHPTLLSYKPEGLEEKMEFAKVVLRVDADSVFECPRYLTASYESVIMFRVAYLHSKLLDFRVPLRRLVESRGKFGQSFPGVGFDVDDYESAFKSWDALSRSEKDDAIKNGEYPWVTNL